MNIVILVIIAPLLAAGVVTLPALYMIGLGGLQGLAVGFVAAWLCAMMLAILGYVKYAADIKGAMGRLIYESQSRRQSGD
jgi:hypothetical protein